MSAMATKATKSIKNNIQKEPVRKMSYFKVWCAEKGILQKDIRRDTKLSIGCIHSLWNEGKASESTIKLLSLVYNLKEEKIKEMVNKLVPYKKMMR